MSEPISPIVVRRTFPWTDDIDDHKVTFRLMSVEDGEAVSALANAQSEFDQAMLRMDITDPAVMEDWIDNLRAGRTITVLVDMDDKLVGYGSLHHNEILWTSHLGELRLLVDQKCRGIGIAARLIAELIHIAREMKLEKVFCQIPAEQTRVQHLFTDLGFNPEAILAEWVRLGDGKMHDLMIFATRLDGYTG